MVGLGRYVEAQTTLRDRASVTEVVVAPGRDAADEFDVVVWMSPKIPTGLGELIPRHSALIDCHVGERKPPLSSREVRRLNDVVCVCVGEVRAPDDPNRDSSDLVIDVAELIWEPIAQ